MGVIGWSSVVPLQHNLEGSIIFKEWYVLDLIMVIVACLDLQMVRCKVIMAAIFLPSGGLCHPTTHVPQAPAACFSKSVPFQQMWLHQLCVIGNLIHLFLMPTGAGQQH